MTTDEDKRIMKRLQEHLESALKSGNKDWFVICLQGSQNYSLAYEGSDIDTKLLTLPSLTDLVLNKPPVNHVHIMPNEEHCDVKDVREYFKIVRKQNINFMEIFFTDWYLVNPKYQDLWLELLSRREEIARSNEYRFLKCCKGMVHEKAHALCHPYPSKLDIIERDGYDGKQLSHAIRVAEFAEKFLIDKRNYKECLDRNRYTEEYDTPIDWLIDLKSNELAQNGEVPLDVAKNIMENIVIRITNFEAKYNEYRKDELDAEIDEFLDDVLYRLISRSLKEELDK